MEHKIDASVAAMEHKIDYFVELLRKEMVSQRSDIMKWLIPVLLGQAGLIVALSKLL